MKEKIETYVGNLIIDTFGFSPIVTSYVLDSKTIKIFIDGTEEERKIMMGREAQNLRAIRRLVICYSRRFNIFVFLELENANHTNHD